MTYTTDGACRDSDMHTGFSVRVFQCGRVRVSPNLPFGGDHCGIVKGSGVFVPPSKRLWLPVCAFLITTPKGRVLVDTGWHRDMSPDGVYDRRAQITSLGSWALYKVNQGEVAAGQTIDEQLAAEGLRPSDLDYVVVSHLDCDHANGLKLVADAKRIMIARDEMDGANEPGLVNRIRFCSKWWSGLGNIDLYDWNDDQGPCRRSFDLFGDNSVQLVNIPGHTRGQVAVKITNPSGKYVLLFADGGYATRSWRDMITSGISLDKSEQRRSLAWIREQSMSLDCIASMACHDPDNTPRVIEF
ncbi:N-acyl homoserine lactonase family protein [Bifidobacterium eulemuris]|uniref:MBL fold hydrolase n=2 Tax=Bifidobacterium eulemuris TaxID=1765219 RepID=A0A261G9R0_9BIFI|nr:N-acyl homoserine lactonase family protein [Bifidobacterium eulemuris]OZG68162.1 MBL fold hydrolase [Bifidobacterium eulemuris]